MRSPVTHASQPADPIATGASRRYGVLPAEHVDARPGRHRRTVHLGSRLRGCRGDACSATPGARAHISPIFPWRPFEPCSTIYCHPTTWQPQGWSYRAACYHCIVTTTTVGYGDIRIRTDQGKLVAIFHILVNVSLLGALLHELVDLRDDRKCSPQLPLSRPSPAAVTSV